MDTFSPEKRSEIMRRVKSTDTSIEVKLRKELWRRGLRGWRIHPKHVLGHPDIVFRGRKIALFIDGCFWHGCPICRRTPRSGDDYWENKIAGNMARDRKYYGLLTSNGWLVIRLWEHEVKRDLAGCVFRVLAAICSRESGHKCPKAVSGGST